MEVNANDIAVAASTAKSVFETVRTMLGVFKDAKDLLPADKQAAANLAIEASTKQLSIAEAEIAQALGYQLCKCQFPPIIMLTVGTKEDVKTSTNRAVFECPSCGANTAHPFRFNRLKAKPGG
jgi:predicted RNA-binding Zn-ribbon protein involved in translation (DUF1610 family)